MPPLLTNSACYCKLIFYFSLNHRSFAPLNVLKKLAGVWITGGKNIMFNQEQNSSISQSELNTENCFLHDGLMKDII